MRVLGVQPVKGRGFTAGDNNPGAEKVAIIGHGIWQRDFGGASDIIGRTVRLNGKAATIVGVMPPGFSFPTNEDLWLPLYAEYPVRPRNDPQANNPSVIGLLRPGTAITQAQAEFTAFAKRFAAAYPDTNKAYTEAQVQPLIEQFLGPQLRGMLWTMLAFCAGVLLIACVNVMNMQFARAALRARELAVRSSLGATRSRLIRQMLTESLLLSCAGAGLGIVLAYFSIDWFDATLKNLENPPPSWMTFFLNGKALAMTVVATMAAALFSGLLPAWMSSRTQIVSVLREGGRGQTSRAVSRASRWLVSGQIVVTCVLLIGSLLQVRSIVNLENIDYGYDTGGLMTARMGLMDGDYPSDGARKLFYDRLLRGLQSSGQFEAAALTSRMRMIFGGNGPIEIEGRVYKTRRDRPNANADQVSGSFFGVTGQKVLEGRTFQDDDLDVKLPVAIVNAAFAKKHFAGESAVGRRFRSGNGESVPYGPWRTIVGVVSMIRMMGPFNTPNVDDTGFYVPFYAAAFGPPAAAPAAAKFATVVVKPHEGRQVESLLKQLRLEVAKVDPNLPLYFAGTPEQHLNSQGAALRIFAVMFTIFGAVAVILAAAGIYGVMSFSVNQRRQEFGVRMALGADSARILGMVLKQGARQVAKGLAAGLGLSLAIAALGRQGIDTILIGVNALDPVTYGAVAALVAGVSLVAVLVPARRATRTDPIMVLRAE